MTALRLSVRDPDSKEELLRMLWSDGAVTIEAAASKALEDEMANLVQHGMVEWIFVGPTSAAPDDSPIQRVTTCDEPEFLPRLGDNLHRQFRFITEITPGEALVTSGDTPEAPTPETPFTSGDTPEAP